jgi:uncharacterized protein
MVNEETQPKSVRRARLKIGVIADAHGYLDPRVGRIFAGADHIIAGGDMLDPAILLALREVAPVTAVFGASDNHALASSLPREATGEVAGVCFAVGHSSEHLLKELSGGRLSTGSNRSMPNLVVFGGTHTPSAVWLDGTLFLDPGTAGSPERDDNDPTVAVVERQSVGLAVRFVPLRRRPVKSPPVRRRLEWGLILPHITEREVRVSRKKRGTR